MVRNMVLFIYYFIVIQYVIDKGGYKNWTNVKGPAALQDTAIFLPDMKVQYGSMCIATYNR